MRKIYISVLTSALLISSSVGVGMASAADMTDLNSPSVVIDGQQQTYDQPPVVINGRTLVPLRGIFEALNANVNWDGSTQTVTAQKADTTITLQIGSTNATKNGDSITLDEAAQIMNGRTMVPVRFVGESLGANVNWDGVKNSIVINSGSTSQGSQTTVNQGTNDQSSKSTSSTSDSFNISDKTGPITYQQALDLALKTSNSVNNANIAVDRAKDSIAQTSINGQMNNSFIPDGATSGSTYSPGIRQATSSAQAQTNYQIAKKNVDITKDQITYSVLKYYYQIQDDIEKKKLADVALDNARLQLQITNVKESQGMASSYDVTQAQSNADQAQQQQQSAAQAVDSDYVAFNNLVGLSLDARNQLMDTPIYSPLTNVDLDGHVSAVVSGSPTVLTAQLNTNLAQLALNLYTFNSGGSDSYKAKQMDIGTAENKAADAQQQLAQSVRNLYYSIVQSETSYSSAQTAIDKAQQNLKLVQTKFNAGMAIQADVTAAQLQVEQSKQALFDVIVKHELAKIAFDKPWATAGS